MSKPSPDPAAAASFKGLALFTPGGDCVYCIDQRKHNHWHLDLCAALQTSLGLADPPYFLLPCFTATVDRWMDPTSHEIITVAEAYPRALRFQTLLNVLFNTDDLVWQPNYSHHEDCSVWVIESYRTTFPQLWERHNLVMRVVRPGCDPEAVLEEARQQASSFGSRRRRRGRGGGLHRFDEALGWQVPDLFRLVRRQSERVEQRSCASGCVQRT